MKDAQHQLTYLEFVEHNGTAIKLITVRLSACCLIQTSRAVASRSGDAVITRRVAGRAQNEALAAISGADGER